MLAKRRGIHYSPVVLNSCKENFSLKKKTLPVQSQQKMAGAAPTAEGFQAPKGSGCPGTRRAAPGLWSRTGLDRAKVAPTLLSCSHFRAIPVH